MKNPWDDITLPSKDISARRVDHIHPLDLFWGKDHTGAYLFVYEFSSPVKLPSAALPDLSGIQAVLLNAEDEAAKNRFVLVLKERSRWEIFLCLCNDLVQTTRHVKDSRSAIEAFLRRLVHWQDFLKKSRSDILTEEAIRGLIGELLFIREHLAPVFGAAQAVKFWQGPEGLPQDFNVDKSAIEVKCQAGSTAPTICITSAQQLCPELPEMYLFVVTLGKSSPDHDGVINLPVLVADVRRSLELDEHEGTDRFNDLLHAVGYIDSDRYLDFSYVLTDEKMYQVTEGFPRICAADIDPAIDHVSYSVNLSQCEAFRKSPAWMEK